MNLDDYQRRALSTCKYDLKNREDQLAVVLGLIGEAGTISTLLKKWVRDDLNLEDSNSFLKQEIGDLLWYLAIFTEARGSKLSDIALKNLERTQSIFPKNPIPDHAVLPVPTDVPLTQRFPRKMSWEFVPTKASGEDHVKVYLRHADPNPFEGAEVQPTSRKRGYRIGMEFGNEINDNEHLGDGYRYHDVLHFSFVAILGWSPVVRGLMGIKRKYNSELDRVEDGARARDTEEALSASLKKLSTRRGKFLNEGAIDVDILDIVMTIINGRECADIAPGYWRHAIHRGFCLMHELEKNGGGLIHLDMDCAKIWLSESSAEPTSSGKRESWFSSLVRPFRTQ